MKRLYPILSALLLLVACAESDTDRAVTQQLQNSPDFHAVFEADDTRTFVDEKVRLLWTEGDLISIFTNTLNQKYEFDGEAGDNSGTFTPISSGQFGSGSSLSVDANYAVYPYNQSTKISYDGELSIELPATQAYAEDSFGVNANTMVAVTQSQNDNFLSFKNLGGFLKLQLYGDVTVKSIHLEGNNGEKIAGGVTVTAKYGKNPTLTMDSDATTSITLDCGAGVKLGTSSSSATEFWIVVPPVTFTKGFAITITDTEGGTMTKSTTKSYAVERNVIKSMAAFKVETELLIPANEIWYTSTDGKIVEPYSDANHQASSSFDANIVSNVYKDGKGTITFDKDVTTIGRNAFFARYNLESIILPNGITSIDDDAFFGCNSLKSIVIPDSVIDIGVQAFRGCYSLVGIVIPDSVTSIGGSAFSGCSSLTSVTIPDSVIDIGDGAFLGCESLTAFYGKYASSDNRCLIVNGVLNSFAPVGLTSYSIPNRVTSIGGSAFSGCSSLTSVTIPDSVTSIGRFTFYRCSSLTSVTIPDSVTSIGTDSFAYCKSLRSIVIPDSVIDIEEPAFAYCESLTAFYGQYASSDNKCLILGNTLIGFAPAGIKSYSIPDNISIIGFRTFACCSLENIHIPDSVIEIQEDAFIGCKSLTSVTIPDRVTKIGHFAFSSCWSLEKVYCKPVDPPILGNYVFLDCDKKMEEINVPSESEDDYKSASGWSEYADKIVGYDFDNNKEESSVPTNQIWYTSKYGKIVEPNDPTVFGVNIVSNVYKNGKGIISFDSDVQWVGARAFQDCKELESINLPRSVESIGVFAFSNCSSLKELNLPDGVAYIESYAFSSCSLLTKVTIPNSVHTIHSCIFSGCSSLAKFYGKYASSDNRCLIVDGVLNSFAPAGIISYSIPYNVDCIGAGVFSGCSSLINVTIPNSVTSIEGSAFEGCIFLANIKIPNSVTSIGEYAFKDCKALIDVTIPESVVSIGSCAFYGCRSLSAFYGKYASSDNMCLIVDGELNSFVCNNNLITYTIPNNVVKIGVSAFQHCALLESIVIPNSVTSIGYLAFSDCHSLESITIPNNVKEIGLAAFQACTSLKEVYCKPSTPPSIGRRVFELCDKLRRIEVPHKSIDSYKTASGWSEYADKIDGDV